MADTLLQNENWHKMKVGKHFLQNENWRKMKVVKHFLQHEFVGTFCRMKNGAK
jgi:hypothetical protein